MYTDYEYRDVEPICYDYDHVDKVVETIRKNFKE